MSLLIVGDGSVLLDGDHEGEYVRVEVVVLHPAHELGGGLRVVDDLSHSRT